MKSEPGEHDANPPYFLIGGGATGAHLRAVPWADAPLGEPSTWPAALGTALALCLHTRAAMAICWGAEYRLFYNDACAPLLADHHPLALGQPTPSAWPALWHALAADLQAVRESGEGLVAESRRLKLPRGEGLVETACRCSLAPIFESDGRVGGVLMSVLDVALEARLHASDGPATAHAEQVRTEAALRLSEERYRTLFEAIDVGFCIVEMKYDETDRAIDYRLVEINPAFERQTGLVGAAGKWVSEVAPGLERHWYDLYGKVGLTGEAIRFENLAEPFGRWYDVRAFRTGAPQDHLVAILFNDITERRSAENALRDLNDRLEAEVVLRTAERDRMWDTSPDLLLVLDFDGVMRRINPAWTHLLGYAPDELLGHHFSEFVVQEDLPETTAAHVLAKGASLPAVDNRYRHKDGSVRWISWSAAPANGAIYATGRDVTAARVRAEELAQAQEALRQSQKMEAVGQLTGGLAHDFNNLLAGISGSLEFIQIRMKQGRGGEIDKYVSAAQGAAKRAAALTHRLLAFSRRQTLAPKPTDIKQLVAGMEELISRTVGPAIAVETINAAGLWPSLIDPSQLENSILNLCINARDAMPHGGRITIETANRWLDSRAARERGLEPGQYVSLCVSDTGTGMTPDVIAKAFDPFFTTKPIGLGTGLGLSMIYGFARQSGGAVTIYSEVGQGAMLCIYLPRHLGEAETEAQQDKAGEAPRGLAGETVLVVDDEPTVRMLVAEVLDDLGYTPIEAGDGAAGLRVLNSQARIDLLVTDVGLPGGMNGRQLADAARQARPGLKVLFITGYAENAVLSHGHLDPGMHVLTKPFEMDVLAERIRALIEGRVR